MPQQVLISGASVAGPALAYWLCRYGYRVTLVERAPSLRLGGYAVDFRGTAMRVLDRMSLTDAVRQRQTRTGEITIVDAQGRKLSSLPDGFTSGDLEIQRGDFTALLYDATRNDVEYLFGDSIVDLSDTPAGVEVKFHSGRTGRYNLVVGADGLHSGVRSLAFGQASQFLRNLGYYIAIYSVSDFLSLGNAGRYYVERGRRVGCFGRGGNGLATASFYFASAPLDYDRTDADTQKGILRTAVAGMRWEAPRLLAQLDGAPDFYFDSLSQVRMAAWSRGRVVLLGDAAACASPMAGMGTSIALVGAYVLAGELKASGGDYVAAFANYEAGMRPFVAAAQGLADSIVWFVPQSMLRLWASQKLWSWLPTATLRELMIEEPNRVASLVTLKDY